MEKFDCTYKHKLIYVFSMPYDTHIVTHNPNIAVACDAEQIIYCEKKADVSQIRYESGAIENPAIRKHVVDVLEGTMPAFDLRRLKYN